MAIAKIPNITTTHRRQNLVVYYSNIKTPFLKFFVYKNGKLVNQFGFDLDCETENEYKIEPKFIKEKLAEFEIPIQNFELVLSLKKAYKAIHLYPKMNYYKTLWFENRELKSAFPDFKNKYEILPFNFKNKNRQIFQKVFIPKKVIRVFEDLARFLKVKVLTYNTYSNFLYANSAPYVKSDYLGIDIYNNICNLIAVYDNKLISMNEFSFETESDIYGRILMLLGKNELEFELDPLESFVLSSDITVNFKSLYSILDRVHDGINFTKYHNNGVKL